jgi:hypothetical protein
MGNGITDPRRKKVAQKCNLKTGQTKQSPIGRKFVQSGHPD